MKRMPYVKQILLICQVLFLLFVIPSCSQDKSNSLTESNSLTVGTGAPGGSYHLTGLAISSIVNNKQEVHGFRLLEEFSSGSVSNINAIVAGDIQFGIAQSDRQYQAFNGLAEWKEKGPQKDLRAVFSLYPESVTLVASGHSDIAAIHDLRGKRVDISLPGSGARQNAIEVLSAAGIEWEKDIKVHEEKLDDRINMLMHGRLDAFFHTVGHPSQDIKSATFLVGGIRFIPPVNIEQILSEKPYYSKSFIPMELYPFAINKEDVETIGVRATFLTSAKVPDDIVYAVTKAVFDDLESLGYYSHVLKRTVRKENMLDGLTAPIHPGALRFYQEIGLEVPPSSL
jgi:TRAP transporter TAXI family solute receptor